MEWVETTGKSLTEAKDLALDQLGVAADEAEFEVLEEPKSGLFGRVRGEARVRARVKPTAVRPKQDRRTRGRDRKGAKKSSGGSAKQGARPDRGRDADAPATSTATAERSDGGTSDGGAPDGGESRRHRPKQNKEQRVERERQESDVTPQEVGDAAVAFMSGLAEAFGVADADTELVVDGTDLEVRVTGSDVGLMVGPGGRTLTAVQDLARVASQRRLGDHDTRLRIDVGGYREKRREALEKFTATVAQQVVDTAAPKALEPMASSDRKIVHDTVIDIEGVTSHSEGDEPRRRVVITPE
ncbi:MAG: hypothetical protein HKN41_01035 [Ilumatobacter sp.]|nr:hypothetical protein [Ilumatobacter sp.]